MTATKIVNAAGFLGIFAAKPHLRQLIHAMTIENSPWLSDEDVSPSTNERILKALQSLKDLEKDHARGVLRSLPIPMKGCYPNPSLALQFNSKDLGRELAQMGTAYEGMSSIAKYGRDFALDDFLKEPQLSHVFSI